MTNHMNEISKLDEDVINKRINEIASQHSQKLANRFSTKKLEKLTVSSFDKNGKTIGKALLFHVRIDKQDNPYHVDEVTIIIAQKEHFVPCTHIEGYVFDCMSKSIEDKTIDDNSSYFVHKPTADSKKHIQKSQQDTLPTFLTLNEWGKSKHSTVELAPNFVKVADSGKSEIIQAGSTTASYGMHMSRDSRVLVIPASEFLKK